MKTDGGGLTRPAPGQRSRLANPVLAAPARRPPALRSAALAAAHLLTPSVGLANRFLTSSVACATSLDVSSTLPLHYSQSLGPKLPRALCPLTSPHRIFGLATSRHLNLCPLTSAPLKDKADQASPSVERERLHGAPTKVPFSTGQWAAEDLTEVSVPMPSYNLSAQEYDDLEQARGALFAEELRDVPEPSQNQDNKLREKKEALLNGVCCSLIEGANFTDAENQTRLHLLGLCQEIADQEPEFILKVALYTRQELNIRSTANFLLALSARLPPCRPHLRRYFCRAVQLPSDWTEVAKIYQSLVESSRKVAPYPSCLRQALTDRFKLFDEYQLAKYNTRKQRCKSNTARRRMVAEPSPALKEDKPKVIDQFSLKKLIRWLHLKDPAYHIMCLLGRRYPSDLPSFARSRLPGPWDSRRAGKRMKLQVPETWERQLSLHGSAARGWEELIDHQKLPFMAMLRNLRNMIAAGISDRHHQLNLRRLTDQPSRAKSARVGFTRGGGLQSGGQIWASSPQSSGYFCCLYSRVIERSDGSLLMVEGPRQTSLVAVGKSDKPSTEDTQQEEEQDTQREEEQDTQREEEQDTQREEGQDTQREEEQDTQREEGHDTEGEEGHDTEGEEGHDTEGEEEQDTQREEEQDTQREEGHDTEGEEGHDTEGEEGHDTEGEEEQDTQREEGHDTQREEGHDTEGEEGHDTEGEEDDEEDTESDELADELSDYDSFDVLPWGPESEETVDTSVWLTVVKESGTTPGGARSMLCADSRGRLWRSAWDPTAVPPEETIEQHGRELSNWTRKQVHSDRVTAVTETNDLIVTASLDQTVRLWDRESLKQVGLFTCQAPVLCLEANPVSPGVGVCGDSAGNVYFLRWNGRPADG
uniref:uncharacterized protein n=1 Tax=Pristiophorus japonicus TaxID=55135 RepID=UPI00398F80EF